MPELHTQLFEIANGMNLPITFADPDLADCPLVHCNPEFEILTGYESNDLIGKNCRFLQRGDTDHAALESLRLAIQKRQFCTTVLSNYRADGTQFNNFLFIEPITVVPGKQLLMGCQNEFKNFSSSAEIINGSKNLIDDHQRLQRQINAHKEIFQDALKMRADTAVLMIKNYLLRRSASQRAK